MSIYKDCDIRGIYQKELFEKDAFAVGRALAALAPGDFVLGGDVRVSTPSLKEALEEGLLASGARVIDIGTVPTPCLYYSMKAAGAAAGATVTASHNPKEYNGIKFMLGDMPVTRARIDEVKALAEGGVFPEKKGTLEKRDLLSAYKDSLVSRFGSRPRRLRVLIDAGSGAVSRVAPEVFRRCGYEVRELNCEEDGTFPNRSPNPADYSCLGATSAAVRDCKADMGAAFDGDGDRAVFLDETGAPVQNERALVLFIRKLLAGSPSSVVYDQKSSSVVRDAILAMGGTPLPERSGHAFIKRRFLENGSRLAGEVSGHFFFGELGYDDGLFAALMMAELVEESGKTMSDLLRDIVCPPITPDLRFPCRYGDMDDQLKRAEELAGRMGAKLSYLDGVRADFDDSWFLMRKSVTAEQITLRAEAKTEEKLKELLKKIESCLDPSVREYIRLPEDRK